MFPLYTVNAIGDKNATGAPQLFCPKLNAVASLAERGGFPFLGSV